MTRRLVDALAFDRQPVSVDMANLWLQHAAGPSAPMDPATAARHAVQPVYAVAHTRFDAEQTRQQAQHEGRQEEFLAECSRRGAPTR
jgi:hypothetical protein